MGDMPSLSVSANPLLSVRATKQVLYFFSMLVVLSDVQTKVKKYGHEQLRTPSLAAQVSSYFKGLGSTKEN